MKTIVLVMLTMLVFRTASAQLINPSGPNGPCEMQPDGRCITIHRPTVPPWYQQQQQGYPQQGYPQQSTQYMLCYSNEPVQGTRNMFITNVFQTNETEADAQYELDQYAQQQRYLVTFTCQSGDFQSLQRQVGQITVNMANRGFSVNQLRHR